MNPPLRIWPALLCLVLMVVLRYVTPLVDEGPAYLWMATAFSPIIGALLLLIWWVGWSRATRTEKVVGTLFLLLALALSIVYSHPSMLGPGSVMLTIPLGVGVFALAAAFGRNQEPIRRTGTALLLGALAAGGSLLLRSNGMDGSMSNAYVWRWTPTSDAALAAETASGMQGEALADALTGGLAHPQWPEFRGRDRLGIQRGTRFATDWEASPPETLWKVPLGKGWSSFSVAEPLLFTQDQRGDYETVVCLHAETGEELWTHAINARFDEPLGGPGPRATPTLHEGALYVLGAQGVLQRLHTRTGLPDWRVDLREVANRQPPTWGFASSPLIVGDAVIVYAGGKGDLGTLAFHKDSGNRLWAVPSGNDSYASAQRVRLADQDLVAITTNEGLNLIDPIQGTRALVHAWPHNGYRCLQSVVIDDSIIILSGMGSGTRRLRVTRTASGLIGEEQWTSRRLKPDFNDAVAYQGYLYGFDNSIFTCIDLATGERAWKGGRYGKGQVILLEDTGALLVSGEYGEIILLKASPDAHEELSRFQALDAKTWNHPVVVGDRLYLRNGEHATCVRLPKAN